MSKGPIRGYDYPRYWAIGAAIWLIIGFGIIIYYRVAFGVLSHRALATGILVTCLPPLLAAAIIRTMRDKREIYWLLYAVVASVIISYLVLK